MNEAQQQIIDLAKNPLNFGEFKEANIIKLGKNLSCGDQVSIYLLEKDGLVEKIMFEGTGCSISIASASLLSESLVGKKLEDVLKMTTDDLTNLLGIDMGPSRLKCALLPLDTIQQGIKENGRN